MKHIVMFCLLLVILYYGFGCQLHYENSKGFIEGLDTVVSQIGESQITDDKNLIGKRDCQDDYTGDYRAECNQVTGKDVVFGGGSVQKKIISVFGKIEPFSGRAVVRVRQNWNVTEYAVNQDGTFEAVLDLSSGGNYIMVEYEDFVGSVELHTQYNRAAS